MRGERRVEPIAIAAIGVGALLLAVPITLGIVASLQTIGFADLAVYQQAVEVWVAGASPYEQRFEDGLPFLYPPSALVALAPLALVSTEVGGVALVLLGAVLTGYLVRRCHPALPFRWLLAVTAGYLMMEPSLLTFTNGQVSILLVALSAVAVLETRRASGWLLGVASAVKIYPAAYAVVELLRGRRRIWTGLVVAPVGLVLIAVAGNPGLVGSWIAQQRAIGGQPPRPQDQFGNQSWRNLIATMTGDEGRLWVLIGCAMIALAAVAVRLAVRDGDTVAAFAATSLGIVLSAPLVWTHYWVFLPAVAATIRARRDRREIVHAVLVVSLLASAACWIPNSANGPLHFAFVLCGSAVMVSLVLVLSSRSGGRSAGPSTFTV